jgi:hypothetical protein
VKHQHKKTWWDVKLHQSSNSSQSSMPGTNSQFQIGVQYVYRAFHSCSSDLFHALLNNHCMLSSTASIRTYFETIPIPNYIYIPYSILQNINLIRNFLMIIVQNWNGLEVARQYSWLRHYATSQRVAGSNPHAIGFFNWPEPSSCIMALGSTQPLTEMSTRNLPGGKGPPAHKADNLTVICEPTV